MLDALSISTPSGLVLWQKAFSAGAVPMDSLVQDVLLSSSSSNGTSTNDDGDSRRFDKDSQSLTWSLANEIGLIFVVVWPRILHLSYVGKLLETMKTLFIKMYGDVVTELIKGNTAGALLAETGGWDALWKGWDAMVTRLVRELEEEAARTNKRSGASAPPSRSVSDYGLVPVSDENAATTPTVSPVRSSGTDPESIARNVAALKARQKAKLSSPVGGKGRKAGVGGKSGVSSASEASDVETTPKRAGTPGKSARKWDSANSVSQQDMASFDYSSKADGNAIESDDTLQALVDKQALGQRGEDGLYSVADYDDRREDDEDNLLASLLTKSSIAQDPVTDKAAAATPSRFSSLFSKFTTSAGLSSKTITKSDLAPVIAAMREHLMNKNVAQDIAEKVCGAVSASLEGKTTSGFGDGGVRAEVRTALEESLTRILTSKTSTDILLDIARKRQNTKPQQESRQPYVITFVGVNGVGKSTNLSKVAFWLLQNRMRVLIAACDTFRSGAVEQLRTHVRNLSKLKVLGEEETVESRIELFEKGYGKDAAGIAKDAIAYASEKQYDVVLIDTAGRMQDNEPLMRALAKLVSVNNPDKILFVGEAVVGNEAVDQLTKFNRSLRDFSGVSNASSKARGIDGMILTKMDIIDDKVGAALSMTYVTGQPIVFIGTGQTYTDLKAMKVGHVVNALLRA